MNKHLILNIITGIIVGAIYHFLISANGDIVETVIFTVLFIMFSIIIEVILRKRREKKEGVAVETVDASEVTAFIEAIGGHGNITVANHEASRVKVSLKDVDLIDQDELKVLKVEGAFLSGDHLQVTVGKRAESIAGQINEQIKSNY